MLSINRNCSKSFAVIVMVSSFVCGLSVAGAQDSMPDTVRAAVESAISEVKPALVRLHVVYTEYSQGREMKYEASGSGVVITEEGHIVTNHHVAGHATQVMCTFANKEEFEAELVGTDALTDISVVKLKYEGERKFPFAKFGDSSKVSVGDRVLALGSPLALSQSVTLGIVSNTEMIMPRFYGRYGRITQDGEDVGALVKWIGHDAAIYGGNSGGPLINLAGEIVGINEISMGLSGAIPSNVAGPVSMELMERGSVRRSWLGIQIQARLKSSSLKEGLLISGTIKGSPADKAGFEAGDILISLGGEKVDVQFDEQLPDFNGMVANVEPGKKLRAVVLRDGKKKRLSIKTELREKAYPQQHEIKEWGITARDISFLLSKQLKRENRDGVLVMSLRPGGPASEAKPAIVRKDVLVAVNDMEVKDIQGLIEITSSITEGAKKPVPVLAVFERRGGSYLTVVEVGIKGLRDPGLEVKKAWLSAETQVLTRPIAKQMKKPDLKGFRVTRVYPGSTAEKGGLEAGDIIVAVDGQKLSASEPEHYEELPALIRQYKVGTEAELTVLRDGKDEKLKVELVRAPKVPREMKKYRSDEFDFTVRDIAFIDKVDEKWSDDRHGVLVEEVKPGGWAAVGRLGVKALIVEVNGTPIESVSDLKKKMEDIAESRPDAVVIRVIEGIRSSYLELKPNWNEG